MAKLVTVLSFTFVLSLVASTAAKAELSLDNVFQVSTGWRAANPNSLEKMLNSAKGVMDQSNRLEGTEDVTFEPEAALGNPWYPTVKFKQIYRGVEVFGDTATVHYRGSDVTDINRRALRASINTQPSMSDLDAYRVLVDRLQKRVKLSAKPQLKIFRDANDQVRLVYKMATKSMPGLEGRHVLMDAHTGELVMSYPRAVDERIYPNGKKGVVYGGGPERDMYQLEPSNTNFDGAKMTVYSANTDRARANVDSDGYPTDISLDWYDKAIEDGTTTPVSDESAQRAYANTGLTYKYYKESFNRISYDDKDARMVSVVHMGIKMNNAFWTDEFGLMAYGDGDGDHLKDLTLGLDVAGHEITHAVTSKTANLIYAGESGALNEAYSDFFGKMIAYEKGDWYIGAKVIGAKWDRKALRNMINPEEFKQPGSTDSPYKKPTKGSCNGGNDYCGVHTNSGIPNKASALIVDAIGKEKAEQIYYKVLTERLSANASFKDQRKATIAECERQLGKDSADCKAVTNAFDTVKVK